MYENCIYLSSMCAYSIKDEDTITDADRQV